MEDVISYIFTYLPLKDVYQGMQVNKQYYTSIKYSCLWGSLLDRDYAEDYKVLLEYPLYETYKKCYGLTGIKKELSLK